MLSQKYLLSRDEIDEVMKRGKSYKGRFLAVKYLKNEDSPKITAVVSKKVSKGAIKRNKVKRRIREAGKSLIKEGNLINGGFVIMAMPEALNVSVRDILEDLSSILNRSIS